jgi:nitroreductase
MKPNRRTFLQKCAVFTAGLLAGTTKIFSKTEDNAPSKDIFEVIKNRQSVRKFKSTPVPKKHLTKILEAANYAPSPRNRQAWKFVVVQERETFDLIKEECIKKSGENSRQYFTDYLSAPVYVVILSSTKTKNPANDITAGVLAAENLFLAARALGYGTVFCANSIPEDVTKKVLNIPDEYQRICITPIGVPDEWPKMKTKKSLDEVIINEKFD